MSDLTPEAIRVALKPLALLANAPALDADLIAVLAGLLVSERVTQQELAGAVASVLKTETYWTAPSVLLERVKAARIRRARQRSAAALEESKAQVGRLEPGPVLRPDGSPDPEWPELRDRQPARYRKALYEAGVVSLAWAKAPTLAQARLAGAGSEKRGRGPRRLL